MVSFTQRAIAAMSYDVEPLDSPVRIVLQSELVANEALPDAGNMSHPGKESSTRKKDAERGRIARFSRSKRAEVGLCRQKKTAGATPDPEDAGDARMGNPAELNSEA